MATSLTVHQIRISRDLRKGVAAAPDHENALVNVKRSDVLAILDGLDSETDRADAADRQVAALKPIDVAVAPHA